VKNNLIEKAAIFVENQLTNSDESGHDWAHTYRVWQYTKHISKSVSCNKLVAELGALFHDIADAKFHNGNENIAEEITRNWLSENTKDKASIEKVIFIINHVSFRKKYTPNTDEYPELVIVQDADRLDAIGAVGIARAFSFGGYKNRPLYNTNGSQSKNTIAHFYEKLLKLSPQMNTTVGKELAKERHVFMQQFLHQFEKEVNTTLK
jgi:uncharacterized protein